MAFVQGRVQRCDNGQGLGLSVLTDNNGNMSNTDLSGYWTTYSAYPGYRLTASFPDMVTKTHVFTAEDLSAEWVTICLEAAPPPADTGGGGGDTGW